MQWPGLDAGFPGKIYQPLLHNHPTWYAVWCTETESRQADREHIMLSSTAQLHTAATQHNRHWRTYDRHTFAWMSCLHSKSVDAITSTLYDYMCLCGTMLAATQANAYSADSPIYSLTANHHSFRQTTVICIQSNFDNNNSQIQIHYLAYYSVQMWTEYSVHCTEYSIYIWTVFFAIGLYYSPIAKNTNVHGKIYQPLLHNHPTWYAVWCTETHWLDWHTWKLTSTWQPLSHSQQTWLSANNNNNWLDYLPEYYFNKYLLGCCWLNCKWKHHISQYLYLQ